MSQMILPCLAICTGLLVKKNLYKSLDILQRGPLGGLCVLVSIWIYDVCCEVITLITVLDLKCSQK